MEKLWLVITTIGLLLILSFLYYKIMRGYVREEYGKKWLTIWGNKVYFWQSLVFMTGASTVLILLLLKWGNVLTF